MPCPGLKWCSGAWLGHSAAVPQGSGLLGLRFAQPPATRTKLPPEGSLLTKPGLTHRQMIPTPLVRDLRRCLGAENVLYAPSEVAVYDCDAYTVERNRPAAVVFPQLHRPGGRGRATGRATWCRRGAARRGNESCRRLPAPGRRRGADAGPNESNPRYKPSRPHGTSRGGCA